jgi:C4-dicarboxylate-specific signal transduction histidine kinase
VQYLTEQLLAQSSQTATPQVVTQPEQTQMLRELSLTIDRAGGLVSQLKLFSYRSTPHPMALSLGDALLSAWQGLVPHVGHRLAQINVTSGTHFQAWADAQRLGIMLKVLLIEVAQRCSATTTLADVQAHVEAGNNATVVLVIQAHGCTPLDEASEIAASLGLRLCMEIASEMSGLLQAHRHVSNTLHYKLRLPDTSAHTSNPGLR